MGYADAKKIVDLSIRLAVARRRLRVTDADRREAAKLLGIRMR